MQNKEDYRKYKKIYYQNKFNIILYEVMKKESYNQYNEAAKVLCFQKELYAIFEMKNTSSIHHSNHILI